MVIDDDPKPLDSDYLLGCFESHAPRRKLPEGPCIYCEKPTTHQKSFLLRSYNLARRFVCIECSIKHKSEFY